MSGIYDSLIVGGGPAGAALGIALARRNQQAVLLERETITREKVCGEFLSAEAIAYLRGLEVDVEALGGIPIQGVRLATADVIAECLLRFAAYSLSRRVLDAALLDRAMDAGVHVRRGFRVTDLSRVASRVWQAHAMDGSTIRADRAFLCTGKHDLHAWNRTAGKQDNLVAFKMHWRLSAEAERQLSHMVELVLFRGGYCGLQRLAGGLTNLALLVDRETFLKLRSWPNLLQHIYASSPHLQRRLAGAEPLWRGPITLYRIPYGYVHPRSGTGPWRLGDQAAVIPSFAGNGISIALHSARRAAEYVCAGRTQLEYQSTLRHEIRSQVLLATWVSRAMVNRRMSHLVATAAAHAPATLQFLAQATRIFRTDIAAVGRVSAPE